MGGACALWARKTSCFHATAFSVLSEIGPRIPEIHARASLLWCVAISVRHLTDSMRSTMQGRGIR